MKITLEAWAQAHYSPPPDIATLRRWARDGLIRPAPQKVGRTWYVDEDATYTTAPDGSPANKCPSGMSVRAAAILMAT